jgi:hypothetical protein
MKQILSPFQKYECFEGNGEAFLCIDYTIIQDKEDKLVEWCSEMHFKRLRDHKHFILPMSVILEKFKTNQIKYAKCR